MAGKNTKQAAEKLASAFLKEISRRSEKNLLLDFGTVRSNGNLITDTFPIDIGKEDYSVLAHCICKGCNCKCQDKNCCPGIKNCQDKTVIKDGEEARVLVAWAGDEPVVIGVIAL